MCALDENNDLENELGEDWKKDPSKIYSLIAMFRNFSPENPVSNSVIYFWESHTNNPGEREKIKATKDLIYKLFDVVNCEKYEIRTGYLSRHNYLKEPWKTASAEAIAKAIKRGQEEEDEWLERCSPNLSGFTQVGWRDCISPEKNRYYEDCKKLVEDKLVSSEEFHEAFLKSVDDYASKHETLHENGEVYMLEELAWIMSLSLLHINKQVYLIHVGNDNPAVRGVFHHFPDLRRAVKWLAPRFKSAVFGNVAEFLMYYRSSNYAGCSFASENQNIVRLINSTAKDSISKEKLSFMLNREQAEKEFLLSIIGKIPGHVYWLNRNNVYLGCNDLQARHLGFEAKEEIVGKTNKELHTSTEAESLDRTNQVVMESGKPYVGEENASMSNGYKNYLTTKTPLFDSHGKVVGLLGLSVDITDRKRAEALEIENRLQKSRLRDHDDFNQFISRMAHDITSPLVGLEAITKSCTALTEKQQTLLKNVVTNIRSISEALLVRYKENNRMYNNLSVIRAIPVSLAFSEIITQKQQEYLRKDIEIESTIEKSAKFAFINVDRICFDKLVLNLVNNAYERAEGRHGKVQLSLKSEDSFVELQMKDNGKCMPKEMVDKILKGIPIETTKNKGNDIGMNQVMEVVSRYKGKIAIESSEGSETTVKVIFPFSKIPSWFTKKVILKKGSIVAVLDNDEVMHEVWRKRLEGLGVDVKCFLNSDEVGEFIETLPKEDRDNLTLFCDYDLRSSKSGLIVVLELGLKDQAIMVTGVTNDLDFFGLVQKIGLKVILKQFIDDVEIISE